MNNLFNTPEQGQRLKELLPELTSAFVWVIRIGSLDHIPYLKESNQDLWKFPKEFTPALTLQELRDIVNKVDYDTFKRTNSFLLDVYDQADYDDALMNSTAPELAEWVIARLEGKP
jgi:hypothetical protein